MTYEELTIELAKVKERENKWYFKIPIIGDRLKLKVAKEVKDECRSLCNEYLRLRLKEDWNNKTTEERYEIINTITKEDRLYTQTNWDNIVKDLQKQKRS